MDIRNIEVEKEIYKRIQEEKKKIKSSMIAISAFETTIIHTRSSDANLEEKKSMKILSSILPGSAVPIDF